MVIPSNFSYKTLLKNTRSEDSRFVYRLLHIVLFLIVTNKEFIGLTEDKYLNRFWIGDSQITQVSKHDKMNLANKTFTS